MNVTMFETFYNLLYHGVINIDEKIENNTEKSMYKYYDVGDVLIMSDKETLKKFNAARQDIITSDRESAAYAFWYCYTYQKKALNYISETAYKKIINEIIKNIF